MKKETKEILIANLVAFVPTFAILGALAGGIYIKIKNTNKRISNDNKALEKYLGDLVKASEASGKVVQLSEFLKEEDRKPIDPTVIYVYD